MRAEEAYLGVDPGKSGAIALIKAGDPAVFSLKNLSDEDLLEMLYGFQAMHPGIRGLIETQNARAGRLACFSLGGSYHRLKIALTAAKIPYEVVWPKRWREEMGLTTQKSYGARKTANWELAKKLFPGTKILKDDADALLIAEAARRRAENGEGG